MNRLALLVLALLVLPLPAWGQAVKVGAVVPLSWGLVSLLHWRLLPTAPVLAQVILALTLYPAVYWLLSRLERRWLRGSLAV